MISEGTDIPRLRVCAHLSLIRTELFFRQVLGRILRLIPDIANGEGWLFSFAEPALLEFARRLQQDIPENVLQVKKFRPRKPEKILDENQDEKTSGHQEKVLFIDGGWQSNKLGADGTPDDETGTINYPPRIKNSMLFFRLQGKFRQEIFSNF